jgi:hypothetical protein
MRAGQGEGRMDRSLEEFLNSLPEKRPRSRLTPYREVIEEMRNGGWTYQDIAKLLDEKCGVRVSPGNIIL